MCLLFVAIGCSTTKPTASSPSTTSNTATNDQAALNNLVLSVFQQPRQAAIQPCINEVSPTAFTPIGKLQQEQTFRDYTVRVYRDNDSGEGSFEILRGIDRLYAQEGGKFQVGGTMFESDRETPLPIGLNVTGDAPNLVVMEYTGGAHCCFHYHIFEIGKSFRPIASIPAADGIARFEDLDNDGSMEITLRDWGYAYQFTCFADSPAPKVILRYRDGSYFVEPKLMLKPTPTNDELRKKAQEVQAMYEKEKANPAVWGSPVDLWAEMLELIYTGQEDLAWKFFDMAWPSGIEGKTKGLTKFKEVLNKSPFYKELKELLQQLQGEGRQCRD